MGPFLRLWQYNIRSVLWWQSVDGGGGGCGPSRLPYTDKGVNRVQNGFRMVHPWLTTFNLLFKREVSVPFDPTDNETLRYYLNCCVFDGVTLLPRVPRRPSEIFLSFPSRIQWIRLSFYTTIGTTNFWNEMFKQK